MPNKNYNSGRSFEYRIKKWLEERGWLCCRTAGSHSPFDIIAMACGQTLAIQCKYNSKVTKTELQELIDLKCKTDPERFDNICFIVAEGKSREKTVFFEVPYIDTGKRWVIRDDWFN